MRFTGFSFSKNSSIITENMWKRVNKTNSTPHIIYKYELHICMISPVFEEKRALKHFLFRKQFFMILFLFGKCMKRHWHFSPVYVYFIWMLSFIVSHKIYWRSIWLSIFLWKHLYYWEKSCFHKPWLIYDVMFLVIFIISMYHIYI